jgi:peptidoglycan/xylan/chitin deacetylase (PgdA/CDA1 family)
MVEITVCLTFDFDAESAQVRQLEEPVRVSKGQFAIRKGIPRILTLLNKHHIKATFFTCGWVAEKYPERTQELIDNEHEIAAHGYLHEYFDTLSKDEENDIIDKTTEILKGFTNKVLGFRAPYFKLSANTLELLAEKDYIYDSSLMENGHPFLLSFPESEKTVLEFTVEWFLDDWALFESHQHPHSAVLDIWKNQFDSFLEMNDIPENLRVINYTFHPSCIGHAYRINVLDNLISHMKAKGAQFARMGDVARSLVRK